jgi:mono/diheme cytochrome c family protein
LTGTGLVSRAVSKRRPALLTLVLIGAAAVITACGSEGNSVPKSSPYRQGSVLFAQRCAGCHTLDVAGTQGGATEIKNRERTDGPNFNIRHETVQNVLYAIRNGGFSGAIMPQNVVVGPDAVAVARFLAHYAGRKGGQSNTSQGTSGP